MIRNTGERLYTLLFYCIVVCMSPNAVIAQIYQKVVVKEYIPDVNNPTLNATKRPLPQVEVSVKGAGSTVTDEEGTCTLRFNVMQPGDPIVVRQFARPGYELLNPELLRDLVIRRDDKPLEVVMISQDNAIKLSRIITSQVGSQFDKMKLRELNELDILAVDYEKKKKAIIEKYEAKLNDVEQYIDRLVRVDITRVTASESAAFEAFNSGDLDRALQIFENENLITQYRETVNSLNAVQAAHAKVDAEMDDQMQSQKDIQYFLKTQITMLELEGSEQNMRKAKNLLEQLLEIEPFGEYQGKEYMTIAIQLKEYDYAVDFMRRQLDDYSLSPFTRMRLAVNLAAILYEQDKYDEVLQLLLPFEDTMDKMVEERTDEALALYLPVLAQQMLGHCESLAGHRDLSIAHYSKMYDIYLKLRQVDSMTKFYANVTYPRIIRCIRQLVEMEEWSLAETIYNSTFSRVEELYANGSIRERFLWARFRIGHAIMLMRQNQYDEGMRIVFSLIPEVEEIYKKNRPMAGDFYRILLWRTAGYYYSNQRYKDVVRMTEKWFEVADIPYSQSVDQIESGITDPQELVAYKDVCMMYKNSLAQIPQNP